MMNSIEEGARVRTVGSVLLDSYMLYMPEGGLETDLFVEYGGQLVGKAKCETLLRDLLGLNDKIEDLRGQFPRLSRQLEFLADFAVRASGDRQEPVRNEALFALIYCAKDCDLIPDSIPEIGYSDDAAVVELVLARNAPTFEAHSRGRGIDWQTIAGSAALCGMDE
jgi:uncharacterized membrane protein YkvA (DUF1232 family)